MIKGFNIMLSLLLYILGNSHNIFLNVIYQNFEKKKKGGESPIPNGKILRMCLRTGFWAPKDQKATIKKCEEADAFYLQANNLARQCFMDIAAMRLLFQKQKT